MLTGKKFPMNTRAMRMVAEELVRNVISKDQLKCHTDFMNLLQDFASKSRTTKMWVDLFIIMKWSSTFVGNASMFLR